MFFLDNALNELIQSQFFSHFIPEGIKKQLAIATLSSHPIINPTIRLELTLKIELFEAIAKG